ncbi:MAG: LacI family transcriptional regulator, partial [Rhodopirellula sp.]|nr:LacI family transcriptional regulator [Rhodopirellula sp.]
MAVTVKDVAKHAGTSPGTVSQVLNRRNTSIRVSEATRQRVLKAVEELEYFPNAAARSLSTSKTGNIGFILSNNVTDGFANAFFGQQLAGVEKACRDRNYGLLVSLYNLSSLDSFVFPNRFRRCSVDGLVLGGYVEAEVIRKFVGFGIPCICIGDNTEIGELIPTVATDLLGGLRQAAEYAVGLGHRKIGICFEPTRRGQEIIETLQAQAKASAVLANCEIENIKIPNARNDCSDAKPLVEYWLSLPRNKRHSLLMGTDQTLIAALKEFGRAGVRCPQDVSLLGTCDSKLLEHSYP